MPPRVEKVERVADLLLCLLNANEPLTLVQIASQVPGYPDESEARRTQFERDKRTLRESGVPITVTSPNSSAQDGYRILAAEYYLPDLKLEDDERNALRLALSSVRLEGITESEIAVKLGAAPESALPAVMELPRLPALGQLGEAIRRRAPVQFTYRGRERVVEPYALAFRAGRWYLVGFDRGATDDATRTFRVDRIEGSIETGRAGEVRDDRKIDVARELAFSLRAQGDHHGDGDDAPIVLELLVEPSAFAAVFEMSGEPLAPGRGSDGRSRIAFPIADVEPALSWVIGFGDAVEVLVPTELRRTVIERLRAFGREDGSDLDRFVGRVEEVQPGEGAGIPREVAPSPRRPALDAGARLRRIIAMLTYLANRGSAKVSELASRFSIAEEVVVRELELAACFGVPPYTPDQLLEVLVVDDEVQVHRLEALERPLRLTPDEGFALAAAARALLRIDGVDTESSLASALSKLEAVLGEDRVFIEVERPEQLEVLRRAASTNTVVEIEYLAQGRAEPTTRTVEPVAVSFREGKFYLDAFCRQANDWRRFSVLNVRSVTVKGEQGEPRKPPSEFFGPRAFVEGPNVARAVVAAPAWSKPFLEPYTAVPILDAEEDTVLVSLAVGDEEWLGRLLCRLGTGAQVVSPYELRRAKTAVANAALRRYTKSIPTQSIPT